MRGIDLDVALKACIALLDRAYSCYPCYFCYSVEKERDRGSKNRRNSRREIPQAQKAAIPLWPREV
jgi:hypothetical protein